MSTLPKKPTKISLKDLQKNLQKAEEDLKSLSEKLARSLADYDNLEKRTHQRQSDFIQKANATLIDKLLSVLDDFYRAQESLKDQGLDMALDQFWSLLSSEGVEKIPSKTTTFDPTTMDCLDLAPGPKNKVIQEVGRGYLFKGSVIRPAKVIVGSGQN